MSKENDCSFKEVAELIKNDFSHAVKETVGCENPVYKSDKHRVVLKENNSGAPGGFQITQKIGFTREEKQNNTWALCLTRNASYNAVLNIYNSKRMLTM